MLRTIGLASIAIFAVACIPVPPSGDDQEQGQDSNPPPDIYVYDIPTCDMGGIPLVEFPVAQRSGEVDWENMKAPACIGLGGPFSNVENGYCLNECADAGAVMHTFCTINSVSGQVETDVQGGCICMCLGAS